MESRRAQRAQDIPCTTEAFYCYIFRANLIVLKADRDKKEIGTAVLVLIFRVECRL
jgi:hypothetical protein